MVPSFLSEIAELLPRVTLLIVFIFPQVVAGLSAIGFTILYFTNREKAEDISEDFIKLFTRILIGSLTGIAVYCFIYPQTALNVILEYRSLLLFLWLTTGIIATIAVLKEKFLK